MHSKDFLDKAPGKGIPYDVWDLNTTYFMGSRVNLRAREMLMTNVLLTALNLLKLENRLDKQTGEPTVISIASWRCRKFNESLMNRLFDRLGLNRDWEKSHEYTTSSVTTGLLQPENCLHY